MKCPLITQSDKEFLFENYPTTSLKFCMERLPHLTRRQILEFLKINRILKKVSPSRQTCDVEIFKNPVLPELVYFLGLCWADGHLGKKNGQFVSLKLKVQERDAVIFYDIVKHLAEFRLYKNPRTEGQDQLSMVINNRNLAIYLESLDYGEKSRVPPTKILKTIPVELHRFFWLGFFDGDGHLTVSKKKKKGVRDIATMGFAGPYDQDWNDLGNFLTSFRCSFYIVKRISEDGRKGSQLCVFRSSDINHLCSFLYQSYEQDKIGLPRKYEKYLELKLDIESKRKITGVYYFKNGYEAKFGLNYENIYLGRSKTKEGAMLKYDLKAIEILGHRAFTNFPLTNYLQIGTRYWEKEGYSDKFEETKRV